jgi:hypothetical protein
MEKGYIQRTLQKSVIEAARHFPALLISGPRQVGKTTLLKHLMNDLSEEPLTYITLDNPVLRSAARTDPELFLQRYPVPLVIDEIQYAPQLLPWIKIRIDESAKNGRYFLTGSQLFSMMRDVGESLAGRIGLLNIFSLSNNEIRGLTETPFVPDMAAAIRRSEAYKTDISSVFRAVFHGSMPRMITDDTLEPELFYSSYLQTYLERDIRDLVSIRDENRFLRFVSSAAARSAQELVYEDLARDAEIDAKTANAWLSLLVSSGLAYLLQPYHSNAIKRIVKRPKLYFMDTGLCCYLARWNDPRSLEFSAMAGPLFETWVVSEIIKSWTNNGKDVRNSLYFYRDNNGKEIDLLILRDNKLHPVEIKMSADPGRAAIKNFAVLGKLGIPIGEGAVVCMSPKPVPVDSLNAFLPIQCI